MNRRFKIIADYPNSLYKVGSIFKEEGKYLFYNGVNHANFINPANFPHIFKEMEWHEELTEFQLPKFVKHLNGSVRKVNKFINNNETVIFEGGMVRNIKHWFPATEDEYNAYCQTKSKIGA